MANVHPWFANTTVQNGPQWTWDFFEQTNVAAANALPNKPDMSIAEVGWPTVGMLCRWCCVLILIHGFAHRLLRTRVTQTTELRMPVKRTFRSSSTTSCVNRTRWESSISSSSSSMRSGRTTSSVVLRDTGVYSIRSMYLALLQAQTLIVPRSKTLKGITIPDCPT